METSIYRAKISLFCNDLDKTEYRYSTRTLPTCIYFLLRLSLTLQLIISSLSIQYLLELRTPIISKRRSAD